MGFEVWCRSERSRPGAGWKRGGGGSSRAHSGEMEREAWWAADIGGEALRVACGLVGMLLVSSYLQHVAG